MIVVDSDVLIAHLRGRAQARDWLVSARRGGLLAISVVSVAELLGGMRSPERHEVTRLVESLHPLPVLRDEAVRAGEFRRTFGRSHNGIGIADYLIAATAEVGNHELATLNVKHFPMFEGLRPPFTLTPG